MTSGNPSTSVRALIEAVSGAALISGDADTSIGGVTHDTRHLSPGDLFVAVPGLQHDGLEFVPRALAAGAAAIAAERAPDERPGVPVILVRNARAALADLAAAFYGRPSERIPVVGITGTDGKTSTTHLLSAILDAHGLRTGWLTTVNTKVGADVRPNAVDHTTPEAPVVQRTLAEMADADLDVAILETSSHALDLERVRGVAYRVGVFTNLSPEHINFHGSFAAYRAAKRKLFERLPSDGLAVLNADDASSSVMQAATHARVPGFGIESPTADVSAVGIRLSPSGTTLTILDAVGGERVPVSTQLVGRFNVANWLAAYAAATYFGATSDDLVRAALEQSPVPGRMNLVDAGQPFAVIVDFAHTPQALDKALDAVRSLIAPGRRVLLAFGLAGGRDYANRPVMGALAARAADFFVITCDDPYDEDPSAIASQIAAGAREAGAREDHDFRIVVDRRAAIADLVARAGPGDVVLLAGKGHEQRMMIGSERQPWNDAQVAAELLKR
ncbi:MAG: UDP-N-acetylmuramoyl-L-alanyl-D-glutamate--2,6-diaminopimelate ligase [Chloroflexota bacterium]